MKKAVFKVGLKNGNDFNSFVEVEMEIKVRMTHERHRYPSMYCLRSTTPIGQEGRGCPQGGYRH
jgi:hypothetical protein